MGATGAPTSRAALDQFLARHASQNDLPISGWRADATGLTFRSEDATVVIVKFDPPGNGFAVAETRSC